MEQPRRSLATAAFDFCVWANFLPFLKQRTPKVVERDCILPEPSDLVSIRYERSFAINLVHAPFKSHEAHLKRQFHKLYVE